MGGYGSTRWGEVPVRDVLEHSKRLDIREMRKSGTLDLLGVWRRWNWTRGGEPSGHIHLRLEAGEDGRPYALTLAYRVRRPGEEWQSVDDRIPLVWTPCNYGGARPWMVCPGCGERRAVLAAGVPYFRCRECLKLAHGSTREGARDRAGDRVRALRRRLGDPDPWKGAPDAWWPVTRPKGMHRKTWYRLREEYVDVTLGYRYAVAQMMLAVLQRLPR